MVCIQNFGRGRPNVKFDELDYIRIDPCIWGEDDGLMTPPLFNWDTNLTSIKRNNNTYIIMEKWHLGNVEVF